MPNTKEEMSRSNHSPGERHVRRAITEFVGHYHRERNHQGLDNRLIIGTPAADAARPVRRRSRMWGLLNYYDRAA